MDGIESHHDVADDIAPLRSLPAGVDLQCERTGEALIQALQDDVRLLTLLKPKLDIEVEMKFLGEREGRRRRRGLSLLLVVGQERSEEDFDGPTDIFIPTDRYQFLKLSRSYPLRLSYNPCQLISPSLPTHAASSAMLNERSLTVIILGF